MGDRGAHPSRVQIEALIDFLEQNPDLARGYRKHLGARERMNSKWKGIAQKLNSMGGGATKNWKQWSKYFRDKKSATKKKAARRAAARRRTGGGAETVELSAIEEKIVALLGEGYAIGSGPCIHPFNTRRDSAPPSPPQRSSPFSMPMQTASEAVTLCRASGNPAAPSASQPQRSSPMPSTLCRVIYSSSTTSVIADGPTPPNPQGPCSPILPGGNLRRYRRVPPSTSMRRASPVPSPPSRTAPEAEFQTSIDAMRRTPPSQSRRSQLTALSDRLLQMEQERLEMNRQHLRRQESIERRMAAAIASVGEALKKMTELLNK